MVQSIPSQSSHISSTHLGFSKKINHFFRHGGVVGSSFCLVKAAVGAGILNLAFRAAHLGLGLTIFFLLLGGFLTIYSIRMLGEVCLELELWSFEDVARELFNPWLAGFTGLNQLINCVGSVVCYTIVIGDIIDCLAPTLKIGEMSARVFFTILCAASLLPIAVMRRIGFLRHIAIAGILGFSFLIVVVLGFAIHYGVNPTVQTAGDALLPHKITLLQVINGFSAVTFSYNNQFNAPQLVSELSPRVKRGANHMALLSTAIAFVMFLTTTVFGVLAFGIGAEQKHDLLLSFHPYVENGNVVAIISVVFVLFSILCAYGFHVFPIRQTILYGVRSYYGIEPNEETSDDEKESSNKNDSFLRAIDIATGLGVVVIFTIIALVWPNFNKIIDFIGSFCSSYISYVCPPLFLLALRRRKDDFTWTLGNIGSVVMLLLGIFFCVFGTISSIIS